MTWSRWWFLGPLTFKQLGSTDVPWLGDGIVLDLRFRGVKTHQVSRQGIHSASMDSPSRANEFKIVQVSMINEISIEISHTSHLPHPPQRIPTCHCSTMWHLFASNLMLCSTSAACCQGVPSAKAAPNTMWLVSMARNSWRTIWVSTFTYPKTFEIVFPVGTKWKATNGAL